MVEFGAFLATQRDAPHRDVHRSGNLDEAGAERVDLVSANRCGADLVSDEVRREQDVVIDKRELAHTCARQHRGDLGAEGAASDNANAFSGKNSIVIGEPAAGADPQDSRATEVALLAAVIGIEVRDLGPGHQHQVHLAASGECLLAEHREAEIIEQACDAVLCRSRNRYSCRQSNGVASFRHLANPGRPSAHVCSAVDLGNRHSEGFGVVLFRNADLNGLARFNRPQALFERQRQQEPEV